MVVVVVVVVVVVHYNVLGLLLYENSYYVYTQQDIQEGRVNEHVGRLRLDHLHTSVVGGCRYNLYEGGIHRDGATCHVCSICNRQLKAIWLQEAQTRVVRLSRHTDAVQRVTDDVIMMPAPKNSFAYFDPGRLLHECVDENTGQRTAVPSLSAFEKAAISQYVVAASIHKVRVHVEQSQSVSPAECKLMTYI